LAEKDVRRLLEEALQEALAEARREENAGVDARAELRGAFGGAGELAAFLLFVGKAFVVGAAGAAGKDFFDKYLKPKLERRGLYPSGLKRETERKP
jgi:sugar/nucleoside kinase (ribokinase family)